MIRKKSIPPLTRRSFASIWDELDYLCKKIHYWLYTRKEKGRAERYLERLERALHDLPENDIAILRQEGLALLCQLKGRIGESISYRGREIELMEGLHREAQSPGYAESTRAYMLRDRDTAELQERRAILAALLAESSRQTGSAIRRSG
jgi:hypothetical protein